MMAVFAPLIRCNSRYYLLKVLSREWAIKCDHCFLLQMSFCIKTRYTRHLIFVSIFRHSLAYINNEKSKAKFSWPCYGDHAMSINVWLLVFETKVQILRRRHSIQSGSNTRDIRVLFSARRDNYWHILSWEIDRLIKSPTRSTGTECWTLTADEEEPDMVWVDMLNFDCRWRGTGYALRGFAEIWLPMKRNWICFGWICWTLTADEEELDILWVDAREGIITCVTGIC